MANKSIAFPVLGTAAAIAITTAMDASGFTAFSALPLLPLAGLFWAWQRFSPREIGLRAGDRGAYGAAVTYPLAVIGMASGVALLAGAVDTTNTRWYHFWLNLVGGGLATILVGLLTEEGFFRGWLWASLRRCGASRRQTLYWSSLAFAAWHVSVVTLDTGFELPPLQIPIYLANVVVIGGVWGILRSTSGSIVVASVSHGIWNGLAYALFAFGTKTGALGVTQSALYGPETGILGLALNATFALALWRWAAAREGKRPTAPA